MVGLCLVYDTLTPWILQERILIKLDLLNYQTVFCKEKSFVEYFNVLQRLGFRRPHRAPLHRLFFVLPSGLIDNGQFSYFTHLVDFLPAEQELKELYRLPGY